MSEERLHFRSMHEKDIFAVAAIERAVFSRPWTEQAFKMALQQDTLFVVATRGDTIIGYCGMYCSYGEGEITNVAIMPEEQRRGIGRKMMEYLLEQAQQRGIVKLILEVRISNVHAIGLYRDLGFHNCGIRRNFYEMPREDGMVMVLEA